MTDLAPWLDRIHHIDALDLLRQLPDDSVDMVLTSPPYDNFRDYEGYVFDFNSVARETYHVLKPGGVLVWVVGDQVIDGSETLTSMRQALYFVDNAGFLMHDTMIYQKNSLIFPDTTRYYQCFEYMFVLSKGKPKTTNLIKTHKNKHGGKKIAGSFRRKDGKLVPKHGTTKKKKHGEYGILPNVWQLSVGWKHSTKDEIAFQHPAIFPEQLAERHILTWSNQGDLVLDPFIGSGTTAKMARKHGRHYIGGDTSAEYVQLARDRLDQTDPYAPTRYDDGSTQLTLFGSMEDNDDE